MADSLLTPAVSTNYSYELAPKTWQLIQGLRSGTAVFTRPAGPIKCAGAPQKIAYLAADYWRQQGVLDDIRLVLVLPTRARSGCPSSPPSWSRSSPATASRSTRTASSSRSTRQAAAP